MLSYRRISRSLVTVLALTFIQVIAAPVFVPTVSTSSASAAATRGTIVNGPTIGGPGGNFQTPAACASGPITSIAVSASTLGGYTNGFGYYCTAFNDNSSLGATAAIVKVFEYQTIDTANPQSCPAGKVAIGFRGRVYSNMVTAMGLICGYAMSGSGATSLATIPSSMTDGTITDYTCDSGKVLVGFGAKTGNGADQVTPQCATYTGFTYAGIPAPVVTNTSYRDASVAFTPPTTNIADTALETFTVTATPSSGSPITVTDTATPILVTGLSPGTSYTYSVVGSNKYGSTAVVATAALTSATPPAAETDTAFALTGTQYAWKADTGTNGVFDISGAITLEAWVYPTETGTAQYTVICKSEAYQIFHKDGLWKYALWGSSSWGDGISTTVPVRTNEWHHVAITRAASTNSVNFYYDGFLVYVGTANTAGTGSIADRGFQFGIGGMVYGGPSLQYPFKGSIDQVAVFSAVRDQATINTDMHSYISPSTSGLRAYYDFNEGAGATQIFNRTSGATSLSDLAVVGTPTFPDVKIVTPSSTYTTIKFPRSYLTSIGGWRSPIGVTKAQTLVIGGGGAGGSRAGGGGGAGLYVFDNNYNLTSNKIESITVGQGGVSSLVGGTGLYQGTGASNGKNGQDTSFGIYAASGGGGGGGAGGTDNTLRNGQTGGSGGGAAPRYSTGNSVPGTSTKGTLGYGNGSQGGGALDPDDYPGGGGGGAGISGMGVSPGSTTSRAGDGGEGRIDPIGGTTICYAAGGGGGTKSTSTGGGGYAGSCTGGITTASAGTAGAKIPLAADANSGSGGGGSGWTDGSNDVLGGSGGSGVIIVKFLVSTARPDFTGPASDTTTAGLTAVLTVTGTPAAPFVRTYQWIASVNSGQNWSNVSQGSGATTATYTTQILTTSMSGIQFKVIVTDTDGGIVMRETSTAAIIIINPAITFTGSYTTQKYGQTHTDTFTTTVGTGTGNKTFTFTPYRSQITWDTSTTNTAALTISRLLGPGTYYETMTATDTKGAQTSQMLSIVVGKADTVTVTALAVTDTYTGSALTFTNQYSVTGLVNSDTFTAMSYNYQGTANGGAAYSLSSTRPVNAGTYSITPAPTLINSDSYTAVITDTATLTINRAARSLAITSKPNTLKYGSSSTLGVTTSGSGDGALTFTTSTPLFCNTSGDLLTAIASYNTCSYSASIAQGNNYLSATSSSVSTSLFKADTLTVTTNAISPVTYTAAPANVTPAATVTGLKLSDSVTANSVWFQYGTTVINGGNSTTTYSSTAPTDADTYIVNPYILVLSSGTLDNYEGVTYNNGSLQITRAQQAPLVISQYSSIFGTPYKVQIFGGSGTGAYSATVSGGTADNCSITGDTLTTTSAGSCWLVAQRNGDKNYETQTASAYIYFVTWVQPITSAPTTGPNIALIPFTPFDRDTQVAPYVSTVGTSGDATYPVAISGQGFTNDSGANTRVKFWRDVFVASGDYIIKSDTLIWSKVPAGATRGRIVVSNSFGSGASTNSFTP